MCQRQSPGVFPLLFNTLNAHSLLGIEFPPFGPENFGAILPEYSDVERDPCGSDGRLRHAQRAGFPIRIPGIRPS